MVYGQPAIAVPVGHARARVMILPEPRQPAGWVRLQAPDIGLEALLADLPPEHPLAAAASLVFEELRISRPPAMTIRVASTIPVAAGMGSGAAVSVALMRALSGYLGHPLPQERISALAYEVEKIHHGTPSGIDNTVVTFGRPVYFIRGGETEGDRIETFSVARPFDILIGDTGMSSSTRQAVGDVGRAWQAEPERYNRLFEQIGSLVQKARQAIEIGEVAELGPLMDQNHALLCEMGVSSKELDELVAGARSAGALGAKLSGGGRGGNMIALVTPGMEETVAVALMAAGARSTLLTTISNNPAEVN